jgi:hypothetical protein
MSHSARSHVPVQMCRINHKVSVVFGKAAPGGALMNKAKLEYRDCTRFSQGGSAM